MLYRTTGDKGQESFITLPFYRVKIDTLSRGMTSFIATSDLQGREQNKVSNRLVGEAIAEELALLQEFGEVPNIDLILLAGDLYDFPELGKRGGSGLVTNVWNAFAVKFKCVIGVHGNHDIVESELLNSNITILDEITTDIDGIIVGGVGGIIGRPDRNQRKTEAHFTKALKSETKKQPDITLLHQGPNDPVNKQFGQAFILEHFENYGEGIVIFGHCHWDIPFIQIGENQVLNVDNRLYLFTIY
ncbi:metallophosphoesterase [Colwellia sp. KU-HH00111]|uniref:metallophosphoesterase n=1 Tax=Colwellia sp. KU-HH00111 TaxID=3127652 RepID=UPI003109BA77